MRVSRSKVRAACGNSPVWCCAAPSSPRNPTLSASAPEAWVASVSTRSTLPVFHAAAMDSTIVVAEAVMKSILQESLHSSAMQKKGAALAAPFACLLPCRANCARGCSELQRRTRPVVATHHVVGGAIRVALSVLVDQRRPLVEEVVHAHVEARMDGRH